jgi:asparagine N-glycosylation enzyme membrane subunit Stt3
MAAALAALIIWLLGGVRTVFVTASDPWRALTCAIAGAIVYFALGGAAGVRRDLVAYGGRLITPLALILALSPAVAGLARNSWTAGGADSYPYVSQADLWLHSRLKTPVPIASFVPWPNGVWSFTPHGYRPAPHDPALVPVTAPGLPLMMAAAKMLGGQCAMFWVTPLCGALLVWMTFAIGRKLGSTPVGLAAAWLMATSPTVLAMLVSPMSDVPAAAFWAMAIFFAAPGPAEAGRCRESELVAAGLSAGAAILIRPNLAPLAVVLVLWTSAASAFRQTLLMVAGILPGVLSVAFLNYHLYGSPLSSGYGSVDTLFSLAHVGINFCQYIRWLVESQTPLALAGMAALAVPARSIWPTRAWRRTAWLLASFVLVVWALYLIYTPFDAWWYLRFLLPAGPPSAWAPPRWSSDWRNLDP